VTKKSEKTSITRESKDSEIPTDFYTMSEVTIKNIQKDESGILKENKKINVLEDSVENVEVDGEKYDLTIDGYKNMQEGEEYTLFLRKSTSGDNYVLTNALLSKYPVEEVEEDKLFLEDGESLEETEDMKDTYQELYQEVLKEYNE
ncbi:phage-related protein, putative, partial [Listeria seeligeri FSL S4-171]